MLNESESLLVLMHTPKISSAKIRQLIHHFGSAQAVLEANPHEFHPFIAFDEKLIEGLIKWRDNNTWKRDLDLVAQHNVTLLAYQSISYPKRLKEIEDYPLLLYVKGEIPSNHKTVAVIGSRACTKESSINAEKISADLAYLGYTVVSGLAKGADAAAHQGSLREGKTIAVIGSGLARLYPKENTALAKSISEKGAVVTEFPMMTPPTKWSFPKRNRIVSGLSWGTLLVEAPIKSGAMITMKKALEQKRKLFVLPAQLKEENFGGNQVLIDNGHATVVTSAEEIDFHFNHLN